MVNISGFPGCCGADVLVGFSVDPKEARTWKMNPEYVFVPWERGGSRPVVDQWLRDENGLRIPEETELDHFLKSFNAKKKSYPDRLYQAILTTAQCKAYDYAWPKILKELGFEFVRKFNNSVHGTSHLYLFIYAANETGKIKDPLEKPPKWDKLLEPPKAPAKSSRKKAAVPKAA